MAVDQSIKDSIKSQYTADSYKNYEDAYNKYLSQWIR